MHFICTAAFMQGPAARGAEIVSLGRVNQAGIGGHGSLSPIEWRKRVFLLLSICLSLFVFISAQFLY